VSDNLDVASEREELERTLAQTIRKPEGPIATGRCLYCDDITGEARWCGAECRDDWVQERARRARSRLRA
jgi:hypothetical protein